MPMMNVVPASKEQIEKFMDKHIKPISKNRFFGLIKTVVLPIASRKFAYNDEDDVGFVTLHTVTGKKIYYQLRGDYPCFVEISGYGNTRYDLSYPDQCNMDFALMLSEEGIKTKTDFFKGSEI
jgi:hypothetical protein